jgi:DNA-binding CsgD family transcriptional regulator
MAGFLEKDQWLELVYREHRQKRYRLTRRELEIVPAVVSGYSNKEIAESYRISEDIVRHHLRNIFEKCGVSMRLKLARLAVGVDRVSDCVEYLREMKSTYNVHRHRKVGLTPLELEIVATVGVGCSSLEIADRLKMSEDQLEQYLKNIISLGDPEEGDEAGIAVKKPKSPNSDSGSATASSDQERRI